MPAKLYDWENWFRRKTFTLKRGVDYSVPQSSIVNQIRGAASRAGVLVHIEDRETEVLVEVKARKEQTRA